MQLHQGNCLDVMPQLPAGSIDAVITDLPYGTTGCAWDAVIPIGPMWAGVRRILKPSGVFITTAAQPFTSILVASNLKWFRYSWVWHKNRATDFLNARRRPLNNIEDILVFAPRQPAYNPQMREGQEHGRGRASPRHNAHYNKSVHQPANLSTLYYPNRVLTFKTVHIPEHPTQKPVELYEYLILTYTNPGETVLDIAAGSGTTGVAAGNTGRRAILIEKEARYCDLIRRRLAREQPAPAQLALI